MTAGPGSGTRAVAVNVGANTNAPGFRGPLFPDGDFDFVPIPESEPATGAPTYGDLAPHLRAEVPPRLRDTPVHLDPEFREYPRCEAYTYGDPHGVKARPLSELDAGDVALFYATLDARGDTSERPAWQAPGWGAYLVGRFRLARKPHTGDLDDLDAAERDAVANNAHVKRETYDAAVLLRGDERGSGLLDRAYPLSSREAGSEPNRVVTDLSADSGKGPWWRRPLRFDGEATATLLDWLDRRELDACF